MDEALRQYVCMRGDGRCEYCHLPEAFANAPFQIDHIIAEKHGGPTEATNLARSCYDCNTFKGPNIAGWLPDVDEVVRLFHPRKDDWTDHFEWPGARLVGRSKIARATISVLEINSAGATLRCSLLLQLGDFRD